MHKWYKVWKLLTAFQTFTQQYCETLKSIKQSNLISKKTYTTCIWYYLCIICILKRIDASKISKGNQMVVFRYQLNFHTKQNILGLNYTYFNIPVDVLAQPLHPLNQLIETRINIQWLSNINFIYFFCNRYLR